MNREQDSPAARQGVRVMEVRLTFFQRKRGRDFSALSRCFEKSRTAGGENDSISKPCASRRAGRGIVRTRCQNRGSSTRDAHAVNFSAGEITDLHAFR